MWCWILLVLPLSGGEVTAKGPPDRSPTSLSQANDPSSPSELSSPDESIDVDRQVAAIHAMMRSAWKIRDRSEREEAFGPIVASAQDLFEMLRDDKSWDLRIEALRGAGRVEEAESAALEWIADGPPSWRPYYLLGSIRMLLEPPEAALGPLETAAVLALGQEREMALSSLAFALERAGRLEEALSVHRRRGADESVARVLERIETQRCIEEHGIMACVDLDEMKKEAAKLEEELRALEAADEESGDQ